MDGCFDLIRKSQELSDHPLSKELLLWWDSAKTALAVHVTEIDN